MGWRRAAAGTGDARGTHCRWGTHQRWVRPVRRPPGAGAGRRSRILGWLLLVLLVAVAGTSYLLGPAYYVARVAVLGNQAVPTEAITELAAVPPDKSIWALDLRAIAARVTTHPLIRTAVVSRGWNRVLAIAVTERRPLAAVPYFDRFLVVDETATVLFIARDPASAPYPVVTGPEPVTDVAIGGAVAAGWLAGALDALFLLTPAGRDRISEAHVDAGGAIVLYTLDGAQVLLGPADAGLAYKVQFLEAIFQDLEEKRTRAEYIDLRFPANPVIRPRSPD